MKRRCYASHSIEAGNMLAVWLDERPECSKDQRDPDGWVNGVANLDFLAKRLAELAGAPDVDLVWQHGAGAEWWVKIESGRRRKESRARNERHRDAQSLIPIAPDVEELGRSAAAQRLYGRGR